MRKPAFAVLALVFVTFTLVDSVRGEDKSDSPGAVVKNFFTAANDAKYSVAEECLDDEAKHAMKQFTGGLQAVCDRETKKGTLSTVDVDSEKVREEGAVVFVTLRFKDGSAKKNYCLHLHQVKGAWQIMIGPKPEQPLRWPGTKDK